MGISLHLCDMSKSLDKMAYEIKGLVDGFLRKKAQMPMFNPQPEPPAAPMGKKEDGPTLNQDSLKKDLLRRFKSPIVNDAQDILYDLVVKLDNARIKQCDAANAQKCVFEAWGPYHIVVKLTIKMGVASIGFVIDPVGLKDSISANKDSNALKKAVKRNQELAQLLNKKRTNYNIAISEYLTTLSDHKSINTDMNPNFFEIKGFMKATPPSVVK